MLRKLLVALPIILFASVILFVSILRTAAVKYDYNGPMSSKKGFLSTTSTRVDYELPFPGSVLPDSPLWQLKALRDKVWILITMNQSKKGELTLLFADKRLGSAKILFERNKVDLGMATLQKAENYLKEASTEEQKARIEGQDTKEFLDRLARASLRHYEIMMLMYESVPDNARPMILHFEETPKKVYEDARNGLLDKGVKPYENPFRWE